MSNKNPLVLFLDTFITADIGDKGGYYKNSKGESVLNLPIYAVYSYFSH